MSNRHKRAGKKGGRENHGEKAKCQTIKTVSQRRKSAAHSRAQTPEEVGGEAAKTGRPVREWWSEVGRVGRVGR